MIDYVSHIKRNHINNSINNMQNYSNMLCMGTYMMTDYITSTKLTLYKIRYV